MNNPKEILAALILPLVAALAGWMARARNWWWPEDLKKVDGTPDARAGRFNVRSMLTELSTVFAIVFITGGIGIWFSLHPLVVSALSATFTYIGIAALGQIAEAALRRRVDQVVDDLGKGLGK